MARGSCSPAFVDEERPVFGGVSLFDVQYRSTGPPPMELPVARYLDEALHGMCGSPEDQSAASRAPGGRARQHKPEEVSSNWRRLRKALNTDSAAKVCAAVAWVSMGILFDVVSVEVAPELRAELSRSWFALVAEIGSRGRDYILDAVPTVLVQAIYRMVVDAFPPDQSLLTKSADKLIEKLGIIINKEVSGVLVSRHTANELRRKLLRKPILEHPSLDLLAARRKEARHQKLAGQKASSTPLKFGDLDGGQPVEETQLEHILELRAQELAGVEAEGLPRLIPQDLSVDRYLHLDGLAQDMFLRQLAEINPEAAEAEAAVVSAGWGAEVPPDSPASPATARAASPLSPMTARCMRSSTSTRKRRLGAAAAERRRRDEALAGLIARPLPEHVTHRTLSTTGTSPLLQHIAPGAQCATSGDAQQVRMAPPKEQFLPKISSVPELAASRPPGGGSAHGCSDVLLGRARRSFSDLLGSKSSKTSHSLPKISEKGPSQVVLPQPPLRVKREVMLKRMEADKAGFESHTFEAHSRAFDALTGERRDRTDGGNLRLAQEEQETVQRHFALLGSRSAPALKHLGAERRAKAKAVARLRPVSTQTSLFAASASAGAATSGDSSAVAAAGPHAKGGTTPWNQLTSSEWSTSPLGRMARYLVT